MLATTIYRFVLYGGPALAALSLSILAYLLPRRTPRHVQAYAPRPVQSEAMADKELYHKLQNVHDYPDAIRQAETRLKQLLDRVVTGPLFDYSPQALSDHFAKAHAANSQKYHDYIQRRKAGGPREMFSTREYAVEWLKLAAPVKYVDGCWVGNIYNSSTKSRQAARLAWQVMTEEYGDGDLEKNHVHLYKKLVQSLGGNSAGDAPRCWTAAAAQQCIGLLAADYFPEALGFNMAYETLPYHLLVTSRELRELHIDDYYFALHITIDNPDSGHAALGRLAVERFLADVAEKGGDMQQMWRRVQAGIMLADGLPTTPGPEPNPSAVEAQMVSMLVRKSVAAKQMHCTSRLCIDGLTVEEWLAPPMSPDNGLQFLRALSAKQPWVMPGDTARSRLVRELEWGGRMFGAFSANETRLVRRWISSTGAYARFVGPQKRIRVAPRNRLEMRAMQQLEPVIESPSASNIMPFRPDRLELACLWLTSISLLELFPLSPCRLASPLGMTALRILRSIAGLPDLHAPGAICAGMDHAKDDLPGLWEIGQSLFPGNLVDCARALTDEGRGEGNVALLCGDMLALRSRPYANADVLMGMTHACMTTLIVDGPLQHPVALRIAKEVVSIIDETSWGDGFVWGMERIKRNIVLGRSTEVQHLALLEELKPLCR